MFGYGISQPVKEMIRRINEDDRVTLRSPEDFTSVGFYYLEFTGAGEYDVRRFPILLDYYDNDFDGIGCAWMTKSEKSALFVAIRNKLSRDMGKRHQVERESLNDWFGVK